MKAPLALPALILLVATGCGGTQHIVSEGRFQKRSHQSGWHIDLGLRKEKTRQPSIAYLDPVHPQMPEPAISAGEPIAATTAYSAPTAVPEPPRTPSGTAPLLKTGTFSTEARPALEIARTLAPDTAERPRWNPWAVPAFTIALATVAYAILGTSELVVVLAVVATLVLASIAVRKGRTNEWRGKGFAIAALMIGALAALVTLVALLAG